MGDFAAQLQPGHALAGRAPIDFRAALNDDQFAAVTAPGAGPALVLAGAGSGKTRTLTFRVAWLLDQGVAPWEILLLTFTNKAAREMLGRVEDLTGVPRTKFWGGTFHSVGQRVLRRQGEAVGLRPNFTIMDEGDAEALLADVIRARDPRFTKEKGNPKPRLLFDIHSYARNTRRPLGEVLEERHPWLEPLHDKLGGFFAAYRAEKLEKQVADYDDLLECWLEALQKNADARAYYQRRFRHILVDEFQDTNQLQSDIVDLLAADHQLMAVGDDAQCIYTWRGANFDNIRGFPARHPGAQIHKIELNYRSTPEILAFANGILDRQAVAAEFRKHLRAVRPAHRKPVVIAALDTRQQAQLVIARVRELHENEGVRLHDIAVLYRAHFQAMDLQLELSRAAVPFTITSGVRFFEQAHVRDLVAHVRFAHNPRDTVAFQRLAALLPKVGPRTADKLLAAARDRAARDGTSLIAALTHESVLAKAPEEARGDFRDLALTLQNLEEALEAAGAARLAPPAEEGDGVPPPGANTEHPTSNAEQPFSNRGNPGVQVSLGLEHDEAAQTSEPPRASPAGPAGASAAPKAASVRGPKKSAGPPPKPEGIIRIAIEGWYGDYLRNIFDNWQSRREDLDGLTGFAARFGDINELLAQLVLLNSDAGDRSAEVNQDTLRLTTIHQAKGLEYPVVFLIGVADGLLPLKRAIEEDNLDEERRLFYVGATRAKDELYVLYPRVTVAGGPPAALEPSRFLRELDPDTFEQFRASPRRW